MSHEEVRLKAYEAQKDNTFDSYVSIVGTTITSQV